MGSRSHGVAAQLPRTTPHISSTQHRLVRQGHQAKEVTLTADRHPGPASTSSNFRDASSSRSVTPHPFVGSSFKKSHNLPASPGHGSQIVQLSGETGALPEYCHGYRSLASTSVASASQLTAGKHPLQLSYHHKSGLLGNSPRAGPHSKGAYQNGVEGRRGAGGRVPGIPLPLSPVSIGSNGSNPSAAASFFARAAQKVGVSSKTKKHRTAAKEKATSVAFPTNFSTVILKTPPSVPHNLLRPIGRTQNTHSGKVRVMLRVCPVEGAHSSFLKIDPHKNQVTAFDPSNYGHSTSSYRRHLPPKMFGFDAVFSPSDPLSEICAMSLVDILQAVVGGADGCLFCYGHARIGKTYTMVGDESPMKLGIIPCAISWLFRLINEQKEHTGARFSVRVSAVEVTGKQEVLKDLLADIASAAEANATSPGMYLREDPVCGTQLENQSELRAPTAERAAHFLDAAIAARTVPEADEDARNSHLLFTIHVYQYRVETSSEGQNGVAGGRSRLHLIDFGSCSRNSEGSALSLSALGTVIMALLNGQRHVPYRESALTQLVKEALGSLSCHACMIVHVSPAIQAYNESLQVMQLATRLQRMRTKRRSKFSSTSSEDSSCDENKRIRSRMRLGVRMGTLHEGSVCSTDYTSSSEQSCDTIIFVGENACSLSDRDFTDCEGSKMTAIPRPRFTPPSGLVKTSALSRVDEIIEARHSSGERLYSVPPYAPPSSSYESLIPHSRNAVFKSRLNKIGRSFTEKELLDIDLCKTKDIRAGCNPGRSNGERWVDGPGSLYKGPASRDSEQWVDGPPEFQKDSWSEDLIVAPPASKGGLSSSETRSIATSKSYANSSSISRLPHKAARTAKIAMLFKRELSPGDVEEGYSQSKISSNQMEQEESYALQDFQNKSGNETHSQGHNSENVVDLHSCSGPSVPDSEGIGEVNETSCLHLVSDSIGKESTFCHISKASGSSVHEKEFIEGIEVNDKEVVVVDVNKMVATDDNFLCKPKFTEDSREENGKECAAQVESNCFRDNVDLDSQGYEEKSNASEVDDNQKFVHTAVNVETKIPSVPVHNQVDCLDIRDKSNKPHAVKLDVESLLLHNRESIYELQMDQELEHGSRESLQRLIYGSDDDSSVWNSEPHSVDMEESSEWLEEMPLAALNDLVKQNDNQQNVKTFRECITVFSYSDGCGNTTFCPDEADSSILSFDTTETVASSNLHATDTSINSLESKEKALPVCALSFSGENENSVKNQTETDISFALTAEVLAPRSASTPIKPSNLRLPSQTVSSKIPESVQKSDHYKKPPPVPRTSSLVQNEKCINSSQTIDTISVHETSRKLQSSKMQSMPSLCKHPSPAHKKSEEKVNSGVKKLATLGFRSGHNSNTNSSVPKSNSNITTNKQTAKSAVCLSSSRKIPLLTSKSSLTLVQSPRQSLMALPTAIRKSKQSSKAGNELICARVEAQNFTPSNAWIKNGRLLSPYHLVTKPRISVHSSSCQGSDCSSVAENVIIKATSRSSEVEASSGYESMIRDSEFTGTSSSQDSNSESASTGKGRGIRIFRKRAKGRSRSAPARWFPAEGTVRLSRKMFLLSRPAVGHYCAESLPEEPLEIKTFNSEDVERMSRWRKKEAELQSIQERRCRIQELLAIQATLKRNLARSKEILMVDPESWSYDLHIADNMNRDDPSYLQALEKETAILEKRIHACKSRIMMVTCFDVTA